MGWTRERFFRATLREIDNLAQGRELWLGVTEQAPGAPRGVKLMTADDLFGGKTGKISVKAK